jgi:hypothetical protein
MAPFFESDPFRSIILQACNNKDSILHAVIAIGALDQTCISVHESKSPGLRRDFTEARYHHKFAIQRYSMAISTMQKDVLKGQQDLRTTLLTCLVIALFESFHGNYSSAEAQTNNGIDLLRTWQLNYSKRSSQNMLFSSPAPSIIEDGLVQMFGRLELLRFDFGDQISTDGPRINQNNGRYILDNMPESFSNLYEARIYLELIIRCVKHWLHAIAQSYKGFEINSFTTNEALTSLNGIPPRISTHREPLGHFNVEDVECQRHAHLRDLYSWSMSFQALLRHNREAKAALGSELLRLASKTVNLILTTVFTGDGSRSMFSYSPSSAI